jgi:hypothetical protein
VAVRLDRRRLAVLAACAAYAAAIAFMTRAAWREKHWGFDVVCYSGAALSRSIEDPVELHRAVFEEVERALPAGAFRSVTSDSAYRKAVRRDPVALHSVLRFYVNKPAYVTTLALLHDAGLNVATATRVVSVVSYVIVALLVLAWGITARAGPIAILASGALLCAPPFRHMAFQTSPDMMVCIPILAGTWLLIGRGRVLAGLLVSISALFIRPDVGILVLGLVVWAALAAPDGSRIAGRKGAVLCGVTMALALLLPALAGGAEMPVVLRHSFESRLHVPSRMDEAISFSGYLTALGKGLRGTQLYHPSLMFVYLALAATVLCAALSFGPERLRRPLVGFFAAVWLYVPLHFLLFPDGPDRYFAPTYLLFGVSALFYWLHRDENDAVRDPDAAPPRAASA